MIQCTDPKWIKSQHKTVPCGRCILCLKRKRDEWTIRLLEETKVARSGLFVTLTYNEEFVPWGENERTLCKTDLRNYLKRLRISQQRYIIFKHPTEYKQIMEDWPIRFFATGEYGTEKERPHYHILLYNIYHGCRGYVVQSWQKNKEQIGNVHIGQIELRSIRYGVSDMINRINQEKGKETSFNTMSKKPGIGSCYIDKNRQMHIARDLPTMVVNGVTVKLPRFYAERIFTRWTRERHKMENESLLIEREIEEAERLRNLGHDDPYGYMKDQLYEKARITQLRSRKNKKLD